MLVGWGYDIVSSPLHWYWFEIERELISGAFERRSCHFQLLHPQRALTDLVILRCTSLPSRQGRFGGQPIPNTYFI